MRCGIFRFDEFPIDSTISYDLQAGGPLLKAPDIEGRLGEFRTVWNRRGWEPRFPESRARRTGDWSRRYVGAIATRCVFRRRPANCG